MSYQGNDKWDVYSSSLSDEAPTVKELKDIIKEHIKSFQITKAETDTHTEDYEITRVSITVKKKKSDSNE